MAPNLRPRTKKVKPSTYSSAIEMDRTPSPTVSDASAASSEETTPPVYTIDLSLPPAERYVQVTNEYKDSLKNLQHLFDEVIQLIPVPNWVMHLLARLLLRRVYSFEQTLELRGISQAALVPMYLLVAYNVLLDLFMGCTSGGALVQAPRSSRPRMMHFRSLDWEMPELRNFVVQYDFIEQPGGAVVASTISYVGFVGVLTGVRKDLSVSLNFRPYHNNDSSIWANAKFRFHQLAVTLGFRPSITSILRDFIIPRSSPPCRVYSLPTQAHDIPAGPFYDLDTIFATVSGTLSTAAYLIFCSPESVSIMEKDLATAEVRSSRDFMTVTNHDIAYECNDNEAAHAAYAKKGVVGDGMRALVAESIGRNKCLMAKWEKWSTKQRSDRTWEAGLPLQELKEWMLAFPTSNEMTQVVCIMDPTEGRVKWVRCFYEGEIRNQDAEVEGGIED